MAFENYDDIRPGDVIEIFEREEVERKLSLIAARQAGKHEGRSLRSGLCHGGGRVACAGPSRGAVPSAGPEVRRAVQAASCRSDNPHRSCRPTCTAILPLASLRTKVP